MHCSTAFLLTVSALLFINQAAGLSWASLLPSRQQQQHSPHEEELPMHPHAHGEIKQLPGYSGQLPSKHYGGYISVGSRQLYYYLVQSERAASDPVV